MVTVLAILILLILAGVLYQRLGAYRDLKRNPAPGRMIEVGGTRLHVYIKGTGAPPVIFEAGIAASSLSWRPVQEAVATFTAAAAYDRAGFAWSGPAAKPQTPAEITESLRSLLH